MSMPAAKPPMWDLNRAMMLLRVCYPFVFEAGYNMHLGGKVMYLGKSSNDLDLMIIRQAQVLETNIIHALHPFIKLGYTISEANHNIPFRTLYRLSCSRPGFFEKTEVDLIVFELTGDEKKQEQPYAFGDSGNLPKREEPEFEAALAQYKALIAQKYVRLETDIKAAAISAAEMICRSYNHKRANPPNPDHEHLGWFEQITIPSATESFGCEDMTTIVTGPSKIGTAKPTSFPGLDDDLGDLFG